MTASGGRDVRLLRAVVATVVVIGLGGSAHSMGGGVGLTPVAALVVAAVVGPLVWTITRTRTTVPRMLVATAAGQVVTHLMLVAMAPSSTGTATAVHAHDSLPLATAAGPMPMDLHLSASMVLAHALATLLAGLLLTLGADVARRALRGLAAPVTMVRLAAPRRPRVLVGVLPQPLDGRVVGPLGGRAPPSQAC